MGMRDEEQANIIARAGKGRVFGQPTPLKTPKQLFNVDIPELPNEDSVEPEITISAVAGEELFDTELLDAYNNGQTKIESNTEEDYTNNIRQTAEKAPRVNQMRAKTPSSQSKMPLIIALIIGLITLFTFWHMTTPAGGYRNIEPRGKP